MKIKVQICDPAANHFLLALGYCLLCHGPIWPLACQGLAETANFLYQDAPSVKSTQQGTHINIKWEEG